MVICLTHMLKYISDILICVCGESSIKLWGDTIYKFSKLKSNIKNTYFLNEKAPLTATEFYQEFNQY